MPGQSSPLGSGGSNISSVSPSARSTIWVHLSRVPEAYWSSLRSRDTDGKRWSPSPPKSSVRRSRRPHTGRCRQTPCDRNDHGGLRDRLDSRPRSSRSGWWCWLRWSAPRRHLPRPGRRRRPPPPTRARASTAAETMSAALRSARSSTDQAALHHGLEDGRRSKPGVRLPSAAVSAADTCCVAAASAAATARNCRTGIGRNGGLRSQGSRRGPVTTQTPRPASATAAGRWRAAAWSPGSPAGSAARPALCRAWDGCPWPSAHRTRPEAGG